MYYTIPRTVRELQPLMDGGNDDENYTIPRTVRELQLCRFADENGDYYTIPRTVPARCAF